MNTHKGFTLVEVMLVMVIAGVLLTTTAQSLFQSQQSISLDAMTARFVVEVREQQMRAISGDTAPLGSYIDYSVRLEADRYILFPGSVYDEGNPINTVVTLEAPLVFANSTLPSSTMTFTRGRGEISAFSQGQNSFDIQNPQT